MKRSRKIALWVVGIILGSMVGMYGYDEWTGWRYKNYGGYMAAGIDPIPGAELVFFKEESSAPLPDYYTTWIYKVPTSYTDKLYKDCAVMHYKTGVVSGYEADGTERIDPKKSGCHTEVHPSRSEATTVEFAGDQLTITDGSGD